jgi:hypothetical protein
MSASTKIQADRTVLHLFYLPDLLIRRSHLSGIFRSPSMEIVGENMVHCRHDRWAIGYILHHPIRLYRLVLYGPGVTIGHARG